MSAPIKNTCPDIDNLISRLKTALKCAERGLKENEKGSDAYALFYEIENELWGAEGALEELREANSALRQYGEEMEEEKDSLEEYYTKLYGEIKHR